jgi:hypothetical protein
MSACGLVFLSGFELGSYIKTIAIGLMNDGSEYATARLRLVLMHR